MSRSLPTSVQLGMGLAIFLAACGDDGPTGSNSNSGVDPVVNKEWAFLLYDDADFENAYDPLTDFRDRFRAGDEVHLLVLNDPATQVASILRIDETGATARVREMGEANMGSAGTLSEFLNFAREFYPANRYVIAFYDHGMAWLGSCVDQTNGGDRLTMDEMREGLALGGGVDLVLFTAPCNMGSLEAAYEVRNQTDVYIGSEDSSGYIWWREPMTDISAALNGDPQISNHDLAQVIIQSLEARSGQWQAERWAGQLTMSAVRTDKLDAVGARVDALGEVYLARSDDHFRAKVAAVRPELSAFGPFMVDVHELVQRLYEEEVDEEIRGALLAVEEAMDEAILAEYSGPFWPGAQGLTIFLPDSTYAYRLSDYTGDTHSLDFPVDTRWDELMTSYVGQWSGVPQTVVPARRSDWNGLYPAACPLCSEEGQGKS